MSQKSQLCVRKLIPSTTKIDRVFESASGVTLRKYRIKKYIERHSAASIVCELFYSDMLRDTLNNAVERKSQVLLSDGSMTPRIGRILIYMFVSVITYFGDGVVQYLQ